MNEYIFEDIYIGQKEYFVKTITKEMEDMFREISGDINPLHWDDSYAKEVSSGRYESHVVFGLLTASLYSTMAGVYLPGKYSLIHSIDNISFKKPVYAGEELTVCGIVSEKNNDLKIIVVDVKIMDGKGKIVSKAKMKIIVQK